MAAGPHVAPSATRRTFDYWALRYRRAWRRSLAPSLVVPALYLVVVGVVLGGLVDRSPEAAAQLGSTPYLAFVAPAVVAVAALLVASGEATFPVLGAVQTTHTYAAMLATPLRVVDVVAGQLLWIALRVGVVCGALLVVVVALGAARSPGVVLVLPVALLVGVTFAAWLSAFSVTQRHDAAILGWMRLGAVPLQLFSGVLFPIDALPGALRALIACTPLWHGVELSRQLSLGTATATSVLVHGGYLVVAAGAGVAVAVRAFRWRLVG